MCNASRASGGILCCCLFVTILLTVGCGQSRHFTGTYDEIWSAVSASFSPNRVNREDGHLAYKPEDAPFGSDGYGVIYYDAWINPTIDDLAVRDYEVRVYARGQDIINPFPFLHGYPELEEKKLNRIALELLNIQDPP